MPGTLKKSTSTAHCDVKGVIAVLFVSHNRKKPEIK